MGGASLMRGHSGFGSSDQQITIIRGTCTLRSPRITHQREKQGLVLEKHNTVRGHRGRGGPVRGANDCDAYERLRWR